MSPSRTVQPPIALPRRFTNSPRHLSEKCRCGPVAYPPQPERVDTAAVLAVLPHGTGKVTVVEGGLSLPNADGTDVTLVAHAAAVVRLDVP